MRRVSLMVLLASLLTADSSSLLEFARLRAGPRAGQGFYWLYKGVLRDPLSGVELATAHGIERTQLVSTDRNGASYWTRKLFHCVPVASGPTSVKEQKIDNRHISRMEELVRVGIDSMGRSVSQFYRQGRMMRSGALYHVGVTGKYEQSREGILKARKYPSSISHFAKSVSHSSRWPLSRWISFSVWPTGGPSVGSSREYYTVVHQVNAFTRCLSYLRLSQSPDVVINYRRQGDCPRWVSRSCSCITEVQAYRYRRLDDIPASDRRFLPKEKYENFLQSPFSYSAGTISTNVSSLSVPWLFKIPFKKHTSVASTTVVSA